MLNMLQQGLERMQLLLLVHTGIRVTDVQSIGMGQVYNHAQTCNHLL